MCLGLKGLKKNFFNKCGYDLHFLVKAFYCNYDRNKKVLVNLKILRQNFNFPGCAPLTVAEPPYKPF